MKLKRSKTEKMLQKQCHLLPYNLGKIMLRLRKFGFTEREVFVKNKRQQKSKTQHTNTNTVSVHTTVVLIIITVKSFSSEFILFSNHTIIFCRNNERQLVMPY